MRLRLRQIALVAHQLEPVLDDLRAVLGIEVCYRDPGVARFGLENALLPIGNQLLEVVAPTQPGTAGGRYLDRRGGDGGYMVITQCDDHAPRRRRVEELGIRIVTQFETEHFRNMQLHPKDTGGSFFEIDQQLGADGWSEDGPWEPAGGAGWQSARRLDRVTAIAAAEIQAEDPAAVAARWSEIAEIPLTVGAAGVPVLPLEGSTVRFVGVTDSRGEGLGGLDLEVADRAGILAAARERDAYRSDRQVHLCGMRLNLV
jgi:Glyoxalase-like domain